MTPPLSVASTLRTTHKIDDIQILRGVAILMVLTCHLSFSTTLLSNVPGQPTNPFYAGVELFFVISGFVVTRSLIRGKYEPIAFLIRRAFRLYPPILAFLAVAGTIDVAILRTNQPAIVLSQFSAPLPRFAEQAGAVLGGYLINRGGGASYMFGAMWSLSVEFQFYATAAALAIACVLFRASPRTIRGLFIAGAAAVCGVGLYDRVLLAGGMHAHVVAGYLIDFKFDYMAFGVVLAYLPLPERPIRYGAALSIGLLLATIVVLSFCHSPLVASPLGQPDDLNGPGMAFTELAYMALVGLAVGGNISRALPRALGRLLFWVGERSYTIYLLHFPIMVAAWFAVIPWGQSADAYAIAQLVAVLLILLPVTELVYRQIELRSIDAGARVVGAWRGSQSAPSPVGVVAMLGQLLRYLRATFWNTPRRPPAAEEVEELEARGRIG